MPIYDNNGSVNSLIGRVYDHNGSVQSVISKIYDNNGSVNTPLYQDSIVLFDNGDQCTAITGGWDWQGDGHGSYASVGKTIQLEMNQPCRYGAFGMAWTKTPISNSEGRQLAVTYIVDVSNSQCCYYVKIDRPKGWSQQIDLTTKLAGTMYTDLFSIPAATGTLYMEFGDAGNVSCIMDIYKLELV